MSERTFPPEEPPLRGTGADHAEVVGDDEAPSQEVDRLTDLARVKAAAVTMATVDFVDAVRELTGRCGSISATPRQMGGLAVRADAGRGGSGVHPGREAAEPAAARRRVPRGAALRRRRRPLASVATPDNEAALLSHVDCVTGDQLQALVRDFRRMRRPDQPATDTDDTQDAASEATWGWTDRGRFEGSFDLTPDDGATVEAALDAAFAALTPDEAAVDNATEDVSTHDNAATDGDVRPEEKAKATRADAFAAMAEAALAAGAVDGTIPESHQVVLRRDLPLDGVDLGPLHGLFPTTLDGAGAIVRRRAEAMGCDARTITVEMIAGFPASTPTTSRTFSTSQRRALRARDRTCRYPGCGRARHLHAHHTKHYQHTRCTSVADGILLCRQHHTLLHARGHTITLGVDHAVTVTRGDGTTLRAGPQPPPDADAVRRGRPPDPPPNARSTGSGERITFEASDVIMGHWLTADDRGRRNT